MAESHVYRVGIMSDARDIVAPSPEAAALYYGVFCTAGSAQLMAAVYSCDGVEYEEAVMPWAKFFLGGDSVEAKAKFDAMLKAHGDDVRNNCHVVSDDEEAFHESNT